MRCTRLGIGTRAPPAERDGLQRLPLLRQHALTVFTVVVAEATKCDFGLAALQVFPSLPKQLQLRLGT